MVNEQLEVDRIYGEFRASVARNRGVTEAVAQKNFGEGRVLDTKSAIAAGLVDRIGSLEDVVARVDSGRITLGTFKDKETMAAAFEGPLEEPKAKEEPAPEPVAEEIAVADETWRDENETARLRSRLRREGRLAS